MAKVSLLLLDIGGVLVSNGWDRDSRAEGCRRFGLDSSRYERRHASLVDRFERGGLSLEEYLNATLGEVPPDFPRKDFEAFMFSQSRPIEPALSLTRRLAQGKIVPMAALSNESLELNEMRIRQFGLDAIFSLFFSSCYTGLRKPEPRAYRLVLGITRRSPDACLFIDDREENVAAATVLGIPAVHLTDPSRLGKVLQEFGISGE